VLELPPNQQVWVTMTLEPGRYLLLCTVSDPKGRPHDTLGMLYDMEVRHRGPRRRRMGDWPVPSVAALAGTWLGQVEASAEDVLSGPDRAPEARRSVRRRTEMAYGDRRSRTRRRAP
jgi:hypothetical protein